MSHDTLGTDGDTLGTDGRRPDPMSPDAEAAVETRRRLYQVNDPLKMSGARVLYELPTSPEFLFHEEALRTHRSASDNLTFYTGIGFCAGTLAGGALGACRGVGAAERGETAKLRVNRALNECGSTGRKAGNRLALLGFLFAGTESAMRSLRQGKDDWVNTVSGAASAGAVYGLPAGLRAMAVHGLAGGVLAGACVAGKPLLRKFAPDFAARLEYFS
ncbi:mitochondrial import inner membrane translocase subunit TIM23-2 [Lolium perenne]|uniref:mitochondrial import inner membrane translocase subunit TIM23-2 n=1 Tax=Lolium perenne TaxID=4522 RepID=UPI0021EAD717|nr:mitochondrial import inner membrane translocase subunit TIM23-2-like [Lolium perenne]